MELAVGIVKMIGTMLGIWQQRDTLKNAADVKAAAVAQQEQNAQDKSKQAIASGDLKEMRNEIAE
jgi:hypothetical protein